MLRIDKGSPGAAELFFNINISVTIFVINMNFFVCLFLRLLLM